MCVIIHNSYHKQHLPHFSLVSILVSRFFNHCFPVDKYDTLEYSRVKAIALSMCLWIYLCAFKNTNKLSSIVAGETIGVKILILA